MGNVHDESDGVVIRLMEYAGTTYARESQVVAEQRQTPPVRLQMLALLTGIGLATDIAVGAASELVGLCRTAAGKIAGAPRRTVMKTFGRNHR